MACQIRFKGETIPEAEFNTRLATDPVYKAEVEMHRLALAVKTELKESGNYEDVHKKLVKDGKFTGTLKEMIDTTHDILQGQEVDTPIGPITIPPKNEYGPMQKLAEVLRSVNLNVFNGIRSLKNEGVEIGKKLHEDIVKWTGYHQLQVRKANKVGRALEKLIKKESGTNKILIQNLLNGKGKESDLKIDNKKEVLQLISQMRFHIDAATDYMIRSGMIHTPGMDIFLNNKGKYVARVYEAHIDKEGWRSKVKKAGTPAAAAYEKGKLLVIEHLEAKLAKEKSKSKPNKDTIQILENQINNTNGALDAYIDNTFFSGTNRVPGESGSNLLKGDISSFKKKGEIPPEIRELMGEVNEDPIGTYQATIARMASNIQHYKVQTAFAQIDGLFKLNPQNGYTESIKTKDYPGLRDALGATEVFVPKGLKKYIVPELQNNPKIWQILNNFNALVKWNVTVGSAKTQLRNLVSQPIFLLNNGTLLSRHTPQGLTNAIEVLLSIEKNSDYKKYMLERMIAGGVIDSSFEVDMIKDLGNGGKANEVLKKIGKGLDNKLGKLSPTQLKIVLEGLNKAYQASDNIGKVIATSVEAQRYAKGYYKKSFKTLYEEAVSTGDFTKVNKVLEKATKRTRNTMPNYSETYELVNFIKKVPVAGPFIAFQMEQIRNKIEIGAAIREDLNEVDSNGKHIFRADGIERAAGLGMAVALAIKASALTGLALKYALREEDKDREIEIADSSAKNTYLRWFAAPWVEEAGMVMLGDQDYAIVDPGTLNPDQMFMKILLGDAQDKETTPIWKQLVGRMEPLLGGIFSPEIGVKAIAEVTLGVDQFGDDLYTSEKTSENIITALNKLLGVGLPATIGDFRKMEKDATKILQLDQEIQELYFKYENSFFTDEKSKILKQLGLKEARRRQYIDKKESLQQSQYAMGVRVVHHNLRIDTRNKNFEWNERKGNLKKEKRKGNDTEQTWNKMLKEYRTMYNEVRNNMHYDMYDILKESRMPAKELDYISGRTDVKPTF